MNFIHINSRLEDQEGFLGSIYWVLWLPTILNNLKAHPRKIKKLIESLQGKIELFYLPAYSPELNPDELV
ncbi:MAG: hypothetical protein EHM49_07345 [Deltaproteobacteria bacterium]|nr:MAG: hypothetical protein EHM49_07345 [Deltaproteobacteria bacterium]